MRLPLAERSLKIEKNIPRYISELYDIMKKKSEPGEKSLRLRPLK